MAEIVGVGGTDLCLERRRLKVALAKATEEGADIDDVSCLFRIEGDDSIQVGSDASEAFDYLIDDFDRPTRSGTAYL